MGPDPAALFALVCGQRLAHTWTPGGVPLLVCQRCTGLYAGAAIALALHAWLRLRPSTPFLALHGIFLVAMVPLGLHWVPQDGLARTLSGIVFGAGVVDFLWLNPAGRLAVLRPPGRGTWLRYLAVLGLALLLVPLLAQRGGASAAVLLDALALAGLAALAALVLANGVVALGAGLRLLRPLTPARGGSRVAPAGPPARRARRGAALPR
ncbi:MAG: DUF2085 domain-containing protein [Steroidobacteraceae bacterium]